VLSLANSAATRAQDEGDPDAIGVTTTVDPCVPIDVAHFHRLLSIELGTSIDYRVDAPRQPGRTWVHLSCAPAGIELLLEDGITQKAMIRVLDLTQIEPSSRTRLLALAVAEFVVASWVELRAVPRPSVPAAGLAPPRAAAELAARTAEDKAVTLPQPMAATTGSEAGYELAAGIGLEIYESHLAMLPVLSLRLYQHASALLQLVLGADVAYMAVRAVPVGENETLAMIDVTTFSGLAAVLVGGSVGESELAGGLGVRFGAVHMSGESRVSELRARRFYDPHGGVLALGRLSFRIAERWNLGLELEAGYVTLPVKAEVEDEVGSKRALLTLGGAWVSAGARIAFEL
jgi:hypothetical protein